MRNEACSLMAAEGAPTWYFTMSPSDHNHPICVYWAGRDIEFDPIPLEEKERVRLVTKNPVAAARFFNFMVELFIHCVLRVGDNTLSGLFGDAATYYGTVEQQGRLTLHLHMIIWLCCSLSPQQVRDRLLADDSLFRTELVAYLESVHKGEYFTVTQMDVSQARHVAVMEPGYAGFTEILPTSPPPHCDMKVCSECTRGDTSASWWQYFK